MIYMYLVSFASKIEIFWGFDCVVVWVSLEVCKRSTICHKICRLFQALIANCKNRAGKFSCWRTNEHSDLFLYKWLKLPYLWSCWTNTSFKNFSALKNELKNIILYGWWINCLNFWENSVIGLVLTIWANIWNYIAAWSFQHILLYLIPMYTLS